MVSVDLLQDGSTNEEPTMPSMTTPARTVATQDSSVGGYSTGYRQVHTITFIVAAQSKASILVTVVELFPELVFTPDASMDEDAGPDSRLRLATSRDVRMFDFLEDTVQDTSTGNVEPAVPENRLSGIRELAGPNGPVLPGPNGPVLSGPNGPVLPGPNGPDLPGPYSRDESLDPSVGTVDLPWEEGQYQRVRCVRQP